MDIRIALLAAWLGALVLPMAAGAANPAGPMVSITNRASFCIRIHTLEMRPAASVANGTDRFDRRAGGYFDTQSHGRQIGVQRALSASPGTTVAFEGLAGDGVRITAQSHASPDCSSPMTSRVIPPYETHVAREHIVFDGVRFVRF